VKETPIIMSTESVRATLDGRKSQTRRTQGLEQINRNLDVWFGIPEQVEGVLWRFHAKNGTSLIVKCPYGRAGDRLRVKETWASENRYNHLKPSEIPPTAKIFYLASVEYDPFEMGRVCSALFMPRHFSRLKLDITADPFPQRLQEIGKLTHDDTLKEGYPFGYDINLLNEHPIYTFARYWDSLNAKRGYPFEGNWWVWVITYATGVRLK